ncbi:Protein AIR1 [Lasiodiplodia theobromae]|uniref:Protein AIR1 n=1 Tax=Lasiodiplodia theobromae TaxID=45133 RepID=A0A5N5D3R9_9PEZI|nr:Protein AIR1 [Lasiodiplodia theobromae]
MADDDSRTATLGRKRQRELQDDQANARFSTPEKKVKLDEDDDDESDYSPSPDLPQLESSREHPDSPSRHDGGFPHMSGDEQSAAKAAQLSTAQEKADTGKPEPPPPEGEDFIALPADDDDFAEENDNSPNHSGSEAGSEAGEKGKTKDATVEGSQAAGTQSSRISLTKTQRQLIRQFEEERALRIMRTGLGTFWTAKKGFHTQDAVGAVISMAIPQVPDKKDPNKMVRGITKEVIRTRVVTAIGSNCPMGLLGIYHDQNQSSWQFNELVVFRTQEQMEAVKSFFAATPLEFSLKGGNKKDKEKEFFVMSVLPAKESNKLQLSDNKKLNAKRGVTSILAEALSHYVKQSLESGQMSPGDYEGFSPNEPKKVLQKAAKQDIGAGMIKADPQVAWSHLGNKPQPTSKAGSQATSKPTSVASTKPSTPASEAQDTNNSSDEEGEITPEPVNDSPQLETQQDTVQNSTATSVPNGQMRTHFTQLSESEQVLQVRYFGEPADGLVRCLTCAQKGHMKESCPSRTCQHCQAVDQHFTKNCPTIAKCAKCRERGHSKESCPSKLARSSADGFSCDLCNEKGHPEEECAHLWSSFDPDKIPNLNKVARMTVSCYQCGSQQHWGDDCPMRPRKVTVKSNLFSAKEANKYLIDPQAAAEELRRNGPGDQGMSIRGRAQGGQGQHTYFSSTDDEGDIDNFYRNKRGGNNNNNNNHNSGPGAPSRGNIRINTGAGFRGGRFSQKNDRGHNSGGGGGGYDSYRQNGGNQFEPISSGWQPPLPNEPPPPLPPLPRGGNGGGRGRGGGRGGRGGGGGVNQMPLPPRPQPPSGPSRKPWRGRGGKK